MDFQHVVRGACFTGDDDGQEFDEGVSRDVRQLWEHRHTSLKRIRAGLLRYCILTTTGRSWESATKQGESP